MFRWANPSPSPFAIRSSGGGLVGGVVSAKVGSSAGKNGQRNGGIPGGGCGRLEHFHCTSDPAQNLASAADLRWPQTIRNNEFTLTEIAESRAPPTGS